jgi:preprotein translocase subunit SecF
MATHKPFRELIKAGSNFEFMGRAKLWFAISMIAVIASIGMLFVNKAWRGSYLNWSTDFNGGTEIIFGFHDKAGKPADVDIGKARQALEQGGFDGFEVSEYNWTESTPEGEFEATGFLVRTPEFGAIPPATQERLVDEFMKEMAALEPVKVGWSGDTLDVRSKKPVDWKAAQAFFQKRGYTLKPWEKEVAASAASPEEATKEYTAHLSVEGIDGQYRAALQKALGDQTQVRVYDLYGVGAKAGAKLRNDAMVSMFYASLLVMLYLVVRFDIRYAPGAVIALLHDAVITIGAFAFTWMEFSLTTVAAVLTIIGYSVNDTVVIFDRIRENAVKLKDKRFARIMNISINETLSRSLFTSVCVFATTLMMQIFTSGLVANFAFAMNVGVVAGAYSTVFIASPIALWIHNRWYAGAPAAAGTARPARGAIPADDEAEGDDGDDDDDREGRA